VSDRDGDYAWEMQNARGSYASDVQRSHYDRSIDPLRNYDSNASSALDRWHNDAPSPSKRESRSGPSSPSTDTGWTWGGGGASGGWSGSPTGNVAGQSYLLKRIGELPPVMIGVPLGLAALFLFNAGHSGTCLILSAAFFTRAGYTARKLYRARRAKADSSYDCAVVAPGQVIPPRGASAQFDPVHGCLVVTPGRVIPRPAASHVQPNTAPLPTTGGPVISTTPCARPRTLQGGIHIPPSATNP